MNLLPTSRSLKRLPGSFLLPGNNLLAAVTILPAAAAPENSEGYALNITQRGVEIAFRDEGGQRAAMVTLRQILREHGRCLPCLQIRDWPDFARRGVMLDISRGRVPKLATLLDLAERLADFKINELQLYTEHTFAYRNYKPVWRGWGALTAAEIRTLDARCRELGIDLVPNQNSFGHLREFLAYPPLKKLAEVPAPYASEAGDFLRHPTTLAPNHPGTLPFLRKLYDELLPNFSSQCFNVGCDETWDLGRGQSKKICARRGKGRVYLDFLKKIHHEVSRRDKTMMFWGDIVLKYPKLIPALAKLSSRSSRRESAQISQSGLMSAATIALNWGYEADHPFNEEAAKFAKAKIPFYVCPGTSTWQTLVGKHDNALANLRAAAKAGRKHGARGYLITDWGDGGHPQPLAVSWPLFVTGAALAWNAKGFDQSKLAAVLSRDVFGDDSGKAAAAALGLGVAHRKLGVTAPNETPLGTVVAAYPPERRELFCRLGPKWFTKIPAPKIRAALQEIEKQLRVLRSAKPADAVGRTLVRELELAARMAAESCHIMLWQQAVAAGKSATARKLAVAGIRRLEKLECEFKACWPARNKGSTKTCSPFLQWRIADYRRSLK